jgi:zinc and cadmium transporter
MLIWILLFSIIGSLGSIISATGFLIIKLESQHKLVPLLIAFANGTLLASALLGLIPEALEHAVEEGGEFFPILLTVLIGIIIFFVLEKFIIWHHCHEVACDIHAAHGPIVIVGDLFHNAIDGIVITAGFLSSFTLGVAVSLSVITHEVSQEIGDFAILLHSGYSRKKALVFNYLSSSSTILVAIISYFLLEIAYEIVPYVMAFSAASFIYIALVDISPELHRDVGWKHMIKQLGLIIAGVLTMLIVFQFHLHA